MPLILHIDTATESSIVCLSDDGKIIAVEENHDQKNHAAFVQPAIEKIFHSVQYSLKDIDAVAVTVGPGSYTGLRVGMASAKGLCYALNKPLILINTLEVMAEAVIRDINKKIGIDANILFCPMIDARRMEVFTALYDAALKPYLQPSAMVIDEKSFENELSKHKIIFSGGGSSKMEKLICHENAIFSAVKQSAEDLNVLSFKAFNEKQFADFAYSEPLYLKEFFDQSKK